MEVTRKPVDIIIPIYNAYNDLVMCIESIKKNTNLSLDRVICINDCSTDERIVPYLKKECAENCGIVLLENEHNQGFSNNVNKGMLQSKDRDVILLNSDTIVTKGWVDKLFFCAYSKLEIGTVTPLSNSATLCSVPIMCQDNKMPDNVTVEEFGEIIERCSLKRYPRITVAVGFCMYIKREVIENTGFFDAETFQKGYGEENDFCNRAEQLGYIHVMCDDTFIYHKGTASFASVEKQALIQAHDRYLEEKYPEQMRKNHLYCINNPEQYIRDNIGIHLKIFNKKKNILMMSHLDFHPEAQGNIGGTQFHIRDLTMNLRAGYNIFVMARDAENIRLTVYTDNICETMLFDVGEREKFFQFRNARIAQICAAVLDGFKIQLVHIHHVDGLSYDMFYEAEQRNIPIVTSIHDYNYLCPNYNLMPPDNICCQGVQDKEKCVACLHNKIGISDTVNYLPRWRGECKKALTHAQVFIAPSETAKNIFLNIYPENQGKVRVIEHATEMHPAECVPIDKSIIKTETDITVFCDALNCCKGILSLEGWATFGDVACEEIEIYIDIEEKGKDRYIKCYKGARTDVAKQLASNRYLYSGFSIKTCVDREEPFAVSVILKYRDQYYTNGEKMEVGIEADTNAQNKKKIAFLGGLSVNKGAALAYDVITHADPGQFEWYILGDIGYEPLRELKQENLVKYGTYKSDDLPDIIKELDLDLACIWSIWPETFCYTLSELIQCGVPVLGCDIGAVGERIKRDGFGWLISVDSDYNTIIDKINTILTDVSDYASKKEKVRNYTHKSIPQMIDEYKDIYESLNSQPKYLEPDNNMILSAWQYANDTDNLRKRDKHVAEYVEISKQQLQVYENMEQELNRIKKSRSFKCTEKLMKMLGRR